MPSPHFGQAVSRPSIASETEHLKSDSRRHRAPRPSVISSLPRAPQLPGFTGWEPAAGAVNQGRQRPGFSVLIGCPKGCSKTNPEREGRGVWTRGASFSFRASRDS